MQIQFNKPVTIAGVTYGKGQHEVPAADVKDNWFFDALVEEGKAVVLRNEDASSAEGTDQSENAAPSDAEHSENAEAPAAKGKKASKAAAKETGDA